MSNPLSDISSLHVSRRGVLGMGAALGVGAAVSACGGGSAGTPGGGEAADIAEGRDWTGEMTINTDALGITLAGAAAPQAVSSFLSEPSPVSPGQGICRDDACVC